MNKGKLIWIMLAAVLLRSAVAVVMGDRIEAMPGIYDQISYHTLATRVLDGHGFSFAEEWWPITKAEAPTAHWSYLYTLYLTSVYAIVGIHPLAARLVQVIVVGGLIPWLVYRLAQQSFPGKRLKVGRAEVDLAWLAAAWVGLYPYFIYYGASLMTESFYILSILWTLDCGLRIAHSQSNGARDKVRWVELGLAAGTTVLLRQVFLIFVPFLLAWIVWTKVIKVDHGRWRTGIQGALGGAAAILMCLAMFAPFTYSNYQKFDRFVLLNTNAGYAFFWANHPIHGDSFVSLLTPDMPSYRDLIPVELRGLDEAALENALMRQGIRFVLDDPWRYVKLSISRIPDHFIFWPLPESSLMSNLTRVGSLGVALPFMLVGSIAWIWETFRRFRSWQTLSIQPGVLLLLFCIVYVKVHLLTWAGIRYRLPTDAVGLIFAAYGTWWIVDRLSRGK